MRDTSLLRGVAAIILGFLVLTFGAVVVERTLIGITGIGPGDSVTTTLVAWSIGSRFVVAALAGYLTARTAPKAPFIHAAAFAGVLVFISVAAISGQAAVGGIDDRPWFPPLMSLIGPFGVLAGAALFRMRARGR